MIKYLLIIILAFIATFWTLSVAPVISLSFINPALVIGLFLIMLKSDLYLVWGIFSGLLLDLLTDTIFGLYTISLLSAFCVVLLLQKKLHHNELNRIVAGSLLGVLSFHIALALIIFLSNQFGLQRHGLVLMNIFSWQLWLEFLVVVVVLTLGRFILSISGKQPLLHI